MTTTREPLQPQAALETAVRDALRSELAYAAADCDRTFDERPPPRAGQVFLSVWHDGSRRSGPAGRTVLDQVLGFSVTVTIRALQPFDRAVKHRDEAERRLNAVVALACRANWRWDVINAANDLAGYRDAGQLSSSPVGFCESIYWESTGDARIVDGGHFHAEPGKGSGITQTAHFAGPRHVQALLTAQ